jgi:phosphoglucomutase
MSQKISPFAGKPAPKSILIDVSRLLAAYADLKPDPSVPAQRVAFGTSGHRGVSLERSFNEAHILAISQAICEYRKSKGIDGPLFIGCDTHALSRPAFENALEVLAANGVETMISTGGEFTPTPAVSHAILVYNNGRQSGLADGIVITPSHNPPDNGGFKYNPSNGGPADTEVTRWIENRANALIESGLREVKRMPIAQARNAATTHPHDFLNTYVADLASVIDFDAIRSAGVHMGVDPLGGAGVHYWAAIAEQHRLDLTVVSAEVDPQFAFMTVDWDGKIRMDPSSRYAMQRLIGLKDQYDVAFACDTDHDRHGVVTRSGGLMEPNHYLSVLIDYLYRHRPQWNTNAAVGKTVVSTALIDRVVQRLGRKLYEVPVGFKWFAEGLFDGSLGFGCEESAGASLLRRDGSVWTTDKDGLVPALLSAEITARTGRDPGALYDKLTGDLGKPFSNRVEATATPAQKAKLARLSPDQLKTDQLAGEKIERVLDKAPGNDQPIGGIKAITASGWFAARPSGTEAIYKIYAESFKDEQHLHSLLDEAQKIVDAAIV